MDRIIVGPVSSAMAAAYGKGFGWLDPVKGPLFTSNRPAPVAGEAEPITVESRQVRRARERQAAKAVGRKRGY